MYKFYLKNVKKAHDYEELIKVFLRPEQFIIRLDEEDEHASNVVDNKAFEEKYTDGDKEWTFEFSEDRNLLKKEIFLALKKETGKNPPWGIITGIRPVKLFGEIIDNGLSGEEFFREIYCVSEEKIKLTKDIYSYQQELFGKADRKSVGLYIGIPFCPTRCLYCSFTSSNADDGIMESYLEALIEEIKGVSEMMKEKGIFAESIYIGGGTPTSLSEEQLAKLLDCVNEELRTNKLKEFTVEAGRADTITEGKLITIRDKDISRISINPQTIHEKTLKRIGREHTYSDVLESYRMAREIGNMEINADLIAGLPEETLEDFKESLEEMINLSVDNITIHTLAVKRTSRLADIDKNYHYNHDDLVVKMFDYAYKRMDEEGYRPYYLYRQKNMSGAGENVGFSKPSTEGLYNVRIMDEHQSIIALGAGGISKAYFHEENRLERVANVSNYEVYIQRVNEMIDRKKDKIFKEV